MSRWPEGFGRTLFITVVAGSVFAAFLSVAPRLTAGSGDEATTTTGAVALATTLPSISEPVVAVPIVPSDVQVTVTSTPVRTDRPSGTTAIGPSTTTTTIPDPAMDGSISIDVDARTAAEADENGIFVEGDQIQWRFTVTNESSEELWGAYVYLELHGPAPCDVRNLRPGRSTDCWIATRAVEGVHTAQAWATAWTLDRQVRAEISYSFEVIL